MPGKLNFSQEEQAKLNSIKSEFEALAKAQIEAGLKTAEEANKALEAQMTQISDSLAEMKAKYEGIHVPGLDEDTAKNFSFSKASLALATKDWSKAGFEHEVIQNAQTVSGGSNGSEGGVLVPTVVAKDIIDRLRQRAIILSLGTSELNLSGVGKFELPRLTGSATAYWPGELDDITESSLSFDNVRLDPKKVAAMVRMSRELLADANQSVENIVRNDLAKQLALAIDQKGFFGNGQNDTPLGVYDTPNVNSYGVGANGDPATLDTFDGMIGMLEDQSALHGNLAFVSHPRVFRALRKEAVLPFPGADGGLPIMMPLVSDAQLANVLGYKFGKSTLFPLNWSKGTSSNNLSAMMFGNWEDLIYATWGGLELAASDTAGTNFTKYSVQIRAVARVDFAVRQPKSFVVAQRVQPWPTNRGANIEPCPCPDAEVGGVNG